MGSGHFSLLHCLFLWIALQVGISVLCHTTCDNFRVSPDLVRFMEHPSTTMSVNGTVQLQCKAHVKPIGGFNIVLGPVVHMKTGLRRGKKVSWQLYMVHWEYRLLGETQYVQINCSLDSGLGTNCTSNSVEGGLMTSVLSTNISGSYRCFVYDWDKNLKYSSQHVQVLGDENVTASTNLNSTYATRYIGNETSNVSKPELQCEDGGEGGSYQWFRNDIPLKINSSTLEASNFGVYVCNAFYYRTSVNYSIYRVLPFGCINPVTDLDYPILEHNEDANNSLATKLKFCWNQPTHLGALQSGNVSYGIELGTISGVPNTTYLLNSDGRHCYEANFTPKDEFFTGINISITAIAQGYPSLATQFPDTYLFSWYQVQVNKSCSADSKMTLSVYDPRPDFRLFMDFYILKQTRLDMDEPVPPKLDNIYLTLRFCRSNYYNLIIDEAYNQSISDKLSPYTKDYPTFAKFSLESHTTFLVFFCNDFKNPAVFPQNSIIYACDVPKPPGNFCSISTTHQSITLQWSEPTPRHQNVPAVESYTIEQIRVEDGQTTVKTIGKQLHYTFDDLTPSTHYTFSVYAINGDGRGFPSILLNITTKDYYPSHPQNVTVKATSGRSIAVSWVLPRVTNGKILLYEVKVVGAGTVTVQRTEVTPNTSVVINDLVMCIQYKVTVRAETAAGYGNASHPSFSMLGSLTSISCNPGIVAVISILCVAIALLSSVFAVVVTFVSIQWIRRRHYTNFMRKTLTLEEQPGKDAVVSYRQSASGDEITQYEYEFEQMVSSNSNYVTPEVAGEGKAVGNTDGSSMQGITAMHNPKSGYIHEATFMNQVHSYIIRSCNEEDV